MDEQQIATQWVEKTFITGKQMVPNHVATMLGAMDTSRMTYDEALQAANNNQLSSFLNRKQNDAITQHFARSNRNGRT